MELTPASTVPAGQFGDGREPSDLSLVELAEQLEKVTGWIETQRVREREARAVYDRVRQETDTHEPSNVYATSLLSEFPVGLHQQLATPIPVHRCIQPVLETDPPADCCDGSSWIEGSLAYENDLDWYRYDHPCPGEDCMLRVQFEIDPGPVDAVMSVYREKALWYDTLNPTTELPAQTLLDKSFGGLGASASCFYAYQGHEGDPFNYYLMVRDLADVREWSADQRYRVCVEKVADGCSSPCKLYPDGCGQP